MTSAAMVSPSGYIAEQALIDSANAALTLGQPLLIMGEPGSGKTEAAHYLAWRLGLERDRDGRTEYALRFDTKSTTTGRDLFYTYDAIGRFYAAQVRETKTSTGLATKRSTSAKPISRTATSGGDPLRVERFLTLQALGRAIIQACPDDSARELEAACGLPNSGLARSVVLIDEIDKAPREVPNDLLVELEKLQFHILELDRTYRADPTYAPVLVLTSNNEQALPDAFLRRCVFHAMPFPDEQRLDDILASRVAATRSDDPYRQWLVQFFLAVRAEGFERPPGTAELLGLAEALSRMGLSEVETLQKSQTWQGVARSVLFKREADRDRATDRVLDSLAQTSPRRARRS